MHPAGYAVTFKFAVLVCLQVAQQSGASINDSEESHAGIAITEARWYGNAKRSRANTGAFVCRARAYTDVFGTGWQPLNAFT